MTVDSAPALFPCARRELRLTPSACAKLWISANEGETVPAPWEGRAVCRACPVGAGHAGREHRAMAVSEELQHICAACLKVSDRIINNSYCVSCYNRRREAIKGRNAKGSRPTLEVGTITLMLTMDDGDRRSVEFRGVASGPKALMVATKQFPRLQSMTFALPDWLPPRADGIGSET